MRVVQMCTCRCLHCTALASDLFLLRLYNAVVYTLPVPHLAPSTPQGMQHLVGPVLPLLAQWAAADAKLEVWQGEGTNRPPAYTFTCTQYTVHNLHLMHHACSPHCLLDG